MRTSPSTVTETALNGFFMLSVAKQVFRHWTIQHQKAIDRRDSQN